MTSNAPSLAGDDAPGAVEPIAVIGMSCRVPGARNIEEFWRNLRDGVESVTFSTPEEQAAAGVPQETLDDPRFVRATALLDDLDRFDAAFFGIGTREAELRDPQQRVFLELAHTALEDSGYDHTRYEGEIGVYGSIGADDYQWRNVRRNPRVHAAAGELAVTIASHPQYLSTFTSYKLGLRGPSLTVSTACSSSLVAVHLAVEALRNGECDMALAGGVSFELPVGHGYLHDEGGVLSEDGHTRTFDAQASGTIWSSGGGVVVLKRLEDALADGDHVRSVILGNAINNDGSDKVGFTAPGEDGQAAVISQAQGVAGVSSRTVTYVEAHGTATPLGDPVEVAALSRVFGQNTDERGWCGIGSLKTNIGHLGPASGVAALIKTTLALEHGQLPPSLHFERANERIDFDSSPFYVNARLRDWKPEGALPLRAGISSFGIGGTNAHLVLEEAPRRPAPDTGAAGPQRPEVLRISARTGAALTAAIDRLAGHLREHPELELADVAHTLSVGRRAFAHRAALVAVDPADATAGLADPRRLLTTVTSRQQPQVALLFSGQGSQYAGMGAGLYDTEPVYRAAVDRCADLLVPELGADIREVLLASGDAMQDADARLLRTELAQPALFTVEYALARLWQSYGVAPAAMIGHSVGEYVAATLAGVFELPAALRLIATRGRLMQQTASGAMLAVRCDPDDLLPHLDEGLALAAVNAPGSCVVSGPVGLVDELAGRLTAREIAHTRLRTSHAFHSAMMDPLLADFHAAVRAAGPKAPSAPFVSNLTGRWITDEQAQDPGYWVRHLREPVRFADGVATVLAKGEWLLLECGPGRQLADLAGAQTPAGARPLHSLPVMKQRDTDAVQFATATAALWVAGARLRDPADEAGSAHRVPLPAYPWERKRYWVEPTTTDEAGQSQKESGQRPVEEWFQVPSWRRAPASVAQEPITGCLLFASGPGTELAAALRARDAQVTEVWPGEFFARLDDGSYQVRPGAREDYDALVAGLLEQGALPDRIVHAWTVDRIAPAVTPSAERDAAEAVWQAQDTSFFSLLFLTQALAVTEPAEPVRLDVLTKGTQAVADGDVVHPEHATVAGVVRVLPLEAPWLLTRQIDLDPRSAATELSRSAVAELSAAREYELVALRGSKRWVEGHAQTHVPAPTDPVAGLRSNGVYLITGGTGGIGISIAEDLARRVRPRLVLVSRTGLPPREEWADYVAVHGTIDRAGRAIAAIERMERSGAQVLVAAADVSRREDLRSVRQLVLDRFGRLDGILHTAGVAGGGMAAVKTRETAEAVFAPKLLGPLSLHDVFADLKPDFVAICSSVAGAAGGFGQVDYCAANSFLDAYAHSDHRWGTRVFSIDWSGWAEVGMSAEIAAPESFRGLQRGEHVTPMKHPVLTGVHSGDADRLPWCSGVILPRTHWILDEHRLSGTPLMPGTGYLELAYAAFEEVAPRPSPGHVVELRDVAFLDWLGVQEDSAVELRVMFAPCAEGLEFEILSLAGGVKRMHARGTAAWVEPGESARIDLDRVRERCDLSAREFDGAGEVSNSGLITFGPRWASLRTVHRGRSEALARLVAAGPVAAELGEWSLHPALLDEATSFGQTDGEYMPMGYGRILVRGPLPERMWSHKRLADSGGELLTAQLSLVDETGTEVLAVTDYLLRRVDPDTASSSVARGTAASATRPPAEADADRLMRPTDGAEAFHRLLATDLGEQASITAVPMNELIPHIRDVTHSIVEAELGVGAAAEGGVSRQGEGPVVLEGLAAPLAQIWSEVLGVDRIGADDDFFDLGGNSLVAVQLLSLVRKRLSARIPMRALFEAPTVAAMADFIGGSEGA
ncbi:SDR family NAD(P)-dependent oxidoreductase [Streptomyces eurythermus]|uniref:type I polyketide synthase n=1 Tax=Streptomyces eurythermus TaxID=42237 RepID=UPI0036D37053